MRFGLSFGDPHKLAGAVPFVKPIAADAMAGLLVAYEESLQRLPEWLHESWLARISLSPGPRSYPLLAVALGVGSIPADVFDSPPNRLALLPPAWLCRVLRARGLLRRRPALRRCVDPRIRGRMDDWLHPAVFDAVLLESPAAKLQSDIDGLPWAPGGNALPLADMLAWEGYCLFQRDGTWPHPEVRHLIRIGFDADAMLPEAWKERPGAADGSRWVLERLTRFVPEAPWLCG